MAETLVIRLNSTASTDGERPSFQAQWILVDASGARLSAVLEGRLSDAAGLARSRHTIVLVPGADVLLAEPELPPIKGNARLAQLVAVALEEQLAADIETQHFAVGRRDARPGTPVAVVAHERMQAWQTALSEAGIAAAAWYAETSCVPIAADGLVVVVDKSRVFFRRARETAVLLDIDPLSEALQLAMATDMPVAITLYVPEAEYEADRELFDGLQERADSLQIKLLPDGVLPLLAVQAVGREGAGASAVNLLQGVYLRKTSLSKQLAPWRYAAALAAGLCCIYVAGKAAQLWQLKRQETQLDQAISATYAQAFPGAPSVPATEARRQFEARLLAAQAGGQSSQLMQGLSTLTDALAKQPDTRLDALSFRADTLDLRVVAPNVDALDQIRQTAQTRGLAAEIQAATPRDNKVEGRLQLKTQPSGRGA